MVLFDLSVRSPDIVVRSDLFLPHAATIRDRSLFSGLRVLKLISIELRIKYAGQDTGGRKVIAVILSEALFLVNRTLSRTGIRGQRSG